MDSLLIALVVTAIAALSNWLQRRAQAQQEEPPHPNPTSPSQPPPVARRVQPPMARPLPHPAAPPPLETTLERELRRLLGGEVEMPRHAQPPPIRPPSPPPAHSAMPPRGATMPAPGPEGRSSLTQKSAAARLTGQDSAVGRAHQLHETVAHHLHQGHSHSASLRQAGPGSPEAASLRAIARDPRAARHAFIASLVFGRPKAIDDASPFPSP